MKRLLEQPSILLDPNQVTVKIPLRAAQAILKHFQTQQLGEAADIVTPLVEGIAQAIDNKRIEVMKAVGKSAVDAYKEQLRVEAEEAAKEAARIAAEIAEAVEAEPTEPTAEEPPALEAVNGSAQAST